MRGPARRMAGSVLFVVLFGAFVFCVASDADADGPRYGNPIDLPGTTQAADPSVIRVDSTYYMYPTTDWEGVGCWSSQDMETWTFEGEVWSVGEPGSWNDAGIWAPDVLAYEGRYYLYYTANEKIGVAAADEPVGPFVDVYDHPFIGAGYGESPFNSIDANVFVDEDGAMYMYCTGYVPTSVIRVSRMEDPLTVVGDWKVSVFPGPTWEFFWAEGPWMVKRGGVYYLMYSGNSAMLPFYAIGVATASDPMGPFTKYPGNPILEVDWKNFFYGPGHNSVVEAPDGALWMFYHTKDQHLVGWARSVRRNRIDFDDHGNLYVVLDDDDDDDSADDDFADDDDSGDDDAQGGDSDDDSDDDDGCGW